jgi:hypothetical protein
VADHEPFERQETEMFPDGLSPSGSAAEPAMRRRDVEPVSLVAGMLFILLAVLLMSGVNLSIDWLGHGVSWVLLIGAGVALLINELRKARRRR